MNCRRSSAINSELVAGVLLRVSTSCSSWPRGVFIAPFLDRWVRHPWGEDGTMERGRGEEISTVGVLTLVPSKVRMRKAREVKNVKSKKKFEVTVEHNVDVVIFYQTRKGFCLSHARAHFDRHCMLCFNSINRSNLWNWT